MFEPPAAAPVVGLAENLHGLDRELGPQLVKAPVWRGPKLRPHRHGARLVGVEMLEGELQPRRQFDGCGLARPGEPGIVVLDKRDSDGLEANADIVRDLGDRL